MTVKEAMSNKLSEEEDNASSGEPSTNSAMNGFPSKKQIGTTELGDVTANNIKLLRRLNQVIFPVSYNDKFYRDVLKSGGLAKLAYYNDILVGAVCCRIDTTDPSARRLYIMTLGCLASYRRLGIGTRMVRHVLEYVASQDKKSSDDQKFVSIFLHVQVNNQDAIEFYKRFGFEIVETRKNYYKRIDPPDAHVLSKSLRKDTTKA